MLAAEEYKDIEEKIQRGERLTREDGLRLFHCHDLAWLGAMRTWCGSGNAGISSTIMLTVT